MPGNINSNQNNMGRVNKGSNSGDINKRSTNNGGTLSHGAVHKPVPGKGGKSK